MKADFKIYAWRFIDDERCSLNIAIAERDKVRFIEALSSLSNERVVLKKMPGPPHHLDNENEYIDLKREDFKLLNLSIYDDPVGHVVIFIADREINMRINSKLLDGIIGCVEEQSGYVEENYYPCQYLKNNGTEEVGKIIFWSCKDDKVIYY